MDGEIFGGGTRLVDLHRDWFPEMYNAGITKTKDYLVAMAKYIYKPDDDAYERLPAEIKAAIEELKDGDEDTRKVEKYCNATIAYRW